MDKNSPEPTLHSTLFWSDPTSPQSRAYVKNLAVILLNNNTFGWNIQKVLQPHVQDATTNLFWSIWSSADVTICADGGANQLYERAVLVESEETLIPNYIKGDLDSIRSDVQEFYGAHGAKIIQDPSQNSNDLEKCMELLKELQSETSDTEYSVMIFGGMGKRFDQEMQNVNALFRFDTCFKEICLFSEFTSARLLRPGTHIIEPNFDFERRSCGLIPIAGGCESVTTEGLQWDLQGHEMKFGGLISTSNHMKESQILIRTSHPLVWTTALKD